jgi:hypothetical protein
MPASGISQSILFAANKNLSTFEMEQIIEIRTHRTPTKHTASNTLPIGQYGYEQSHACTDVALDSMCCTADKCVHTTILCFNCMCQAIQTQAATLRPEPHPSIPQTYQHLATTHQPYVLMKVYIIHE